MIFISTPFSRAAANRLESMGVVGYKIGSGECNNYPLIKHIAGFGKPIILSTGMNDICDIMIKVPSDDTPRIQEVHILVGHIICQLIEEEMYPNA